MGFFDVDDYMLKKMSIMGGMPPTLCEARGGYGGSWGLDGTIIFHGLPAAGHPASPPLHPSRTLRRVSEAGGTPEELTQARHPQILPGGKAVLFNRKNAEGGWIMGVLSLETRENKIFP